MIDTIFHVNSKTQLTNVQILHPFNKVIRIQYDHYQFDECVLEIYLKSLVYLPIS